ncbi:MAG: AAA family ATPase, partial [Candidatus Limnocylindrales bacterium]
MRIVRLHLRDFQRHADVTLELAPGLTVVRGPNEAGKSTVQRALELALFRRVTATGADVEAVRRWGGDGAGPTVELEFEHDGMAGRLSKTFAGAKGQALLTFGEEELTDPAAVDRRLAELTGLPSEKFYRSTASVHHYELDDLDRDEAALRDRLQASM